MEVYPISQLIINIPVKYSHIFHVSSMLEPAYPARHADTKNH